MPCKQKHLKNIVACSCSSTTETLNIFYQSIYFMVGFTYGNKRSFKITQSSCLKDAGVFKFVWHFGTTHHERAIKIHVHGYLFCPVRNY